MAQNYRSTVVAPAQIALGVISGIVIGAILEALDTGLWPFAIAAFLVAAGVGYYLATLTVTVDPKHLAISQGRGDKDERVVYIDDITALEARTLTWSQCFGFGIDSDEGTTRMTVRSGPALFVTLVGGEQLRVSTSDPAAAIAALERRPATRQRPKPPRAG